MTPQSERAVDLRAGFPEPVTDAQASFRAVLEAMARPGLIQTIPADISPPEPLGPATAALCLSLVDVDTPLWLAPDMRDRDVEAFLRFHCGCRIVGDPGDSVFAVTRGDTLPALSRFAEGDPSYPEVSTTVIVQIEGLSQGGGLALSGPGIESEHRITAQGLRDLETEWADNGALFPCGVDLILTAGHSIIGLPRTVRIKPHSETEA